MKVIRPATVKETDSSSLAPSRTPSSEPRSDPPPQGSVSAHPEMKIVRPATMKETDSPILASSRTSEPRSDPLPQESVSAHPEMKIVHPATIEETDSSILTSTPGSTHLHLSRRSSMSSVFTTTATPPEISGIHFSLTRMEGGIRSLSDFLEELERTTLLVGIPGDGRVEADLDRIRKESISLNKYHEDGMKEVQLVYNDMMNNGLVSEIQRQVDAQVEAEVNRVVEEQFTQYLKKEYIPDALTKELTDTRAKLNASRLELHNSESMRANALLRKDRDPSRQLVNKLYRSDGTVSRLFPKTLQDVFDLDGEICKTLLQEYEVVIPHKASKDGLLNRFLQLCGIQYQMVRDVIQVVEETKARQVQTPDASQMGSASQTSKKVPNVKKP